MHVLTTIVLSTGWCVFVLVALVAAVLAYCANYYLFDHRSDLLRRAAAIGTGSGVGALFVWLHVAVMNMARHGVAPIPGRGDWLRFHQAFYFRDTPVLFWVWVVFDVFVITAGWLMAIGLGARAGFGPAPDPRGCDRTGSLVRETRVLPARKHSQHPFPLNIPGVCICVSGVLSVLWVHAGLVG
jgi:hypothetical protein